MDMGKLAKSACKETALGILEWERDSVFGHISAQITANDTKTMKEGHTCAHMWVLSSKLTPKSMTSVIRHKSWPERPWSDSLG